jgi:ubiquitin-protein ligase
LKKKKEVNCRYGNICLDLLDSSDWNPTTGNNLLGYSYIHIYIYIDTHIHTVVIVHYLPYLLLNPNPESPYNDVAAELYRRDKKGYQQKVEGECGVYCFVFQLVELLF